MENKIVVIGLTGKARSGKDTAARMIGALINSHNDIHAKEMTDMYIVGYEAYAAPVKTMVAMLLDFFGCGSIMNQEELQPYIEGDLKEKEVPTIGKSPRELMQSLGTEWGRKTVNDNLWVNCMTQRILNYEEAGKHGYKSAYVVVTDCRFDNEAEALTQRHDACIIRITRDSVPEQVGMPDHVSEDGVRDDLVTHTIANDGEPKELLEKLYVVLKDILPQVNHEDLEAIEL